MKGTYLEGTSGFILIFILFELNYFHW
jgi:hypothetical protein